MEVQFWQQLQLLWKIIFRLKKLKRLKSEQKLKNMARVQRIFWDQNNNPVYGIPGYEIKGSKDVTAELIID